MPSSGPRRSIAIKKIPVHTWGTRFDGVCEGLGEGVILGSLFGPVYDFCEGVFKAKSLSGGFDAVRKKGMIHHVPIVAAHCAAISLFKTLISYETLGWTVSFGVVRLICTGTIEGGVEGGVVGGVLGATFSFATQLIDN